MAASDTTSTVLAPLRVGFLQRWRQNFRWTPFRKAVVLVTAVALISVLVLVGKYFWPMYRASRAAQRLRFYGLVVTYPGDPIIDRHTPDWVRPYLPKGYRRIVSGMQPDLMATAISDWDGKLTPRSNLEPLRAFPYLDNLYLANHPLDDRLLNFLIERPNLQLLGLPNSNADDAHVQRLTVLRNLVQLNLENSEISGAGLAAIAQLPKLNHLIIGSSRLDGRGFDSLTQLTQLRYLAFVGPAFNDTLLEQLALQLQDFPLDMLELKDTSITDQGLKHVLKFKRLQSLRINRAEISDAGLAHLQKMENRPPTLYLGKTKITTNGVRAYQVAKPDERVSTDFGFFPASKNGIDQSKLLKSPSRPREFP